MSEGPARAGVPPRSASPPAQGAAGASEVEVDDGTEALEKAYVAPQVLPKPPLPSTPEPDAKVVLNLPASAAGSVSEEEVRAARARRRTATVKIDRAAVAETLGELGAKPLAAPVAAGALLPDGDDATPVDRHRRLRPRLESPAAVVTSRDAEPGLEAVYPAPQRGRSGVLVAVAALAVVGVGAWFFVSNGGVAPTSSQPTTAPPRTPEAPAAAPPSTAAAEQARPAETAETAATAATSAKASPSNTAVAAASQPATPVSTAATKPPVQAPRPPAAAKPVIRPAKPPKSDIPSEI